MSAEKCPDCGTWWRGYEHRCPPVTTSNGTATTITFTASANQLASAIEKELKRIRYRRGES